MRFFELLLDQGIEVNASLSTLAPWDFIYPVMVKNLHYFFSAVSWQLYEHTNCSVLLELWGRVEPEEKNQLLKCQHPLGITLGSTWRLFCMASLCRWGLSQSQDWVKFAAVWQLKITEQSLWILRVSWDTQDCACLWFIASHNSPYQICMKFNSLPWCKLVLCMIPASNKMISVRIAPRCCILIHRNIGYSSSKNLNRNIIAFDSKAFLRRIPNFP